MSIFDLHASAIQDYRDFVRSFFTIADRRVRVEVFGCAVRNRTIGQ